MSIRIEIADDGEIRVSRFYVRKDRNFTSKFHPKRLGEAMWLIRTYLVDDIEAAEAGRFVTQLEKDAKKAYITLSQRSPHQNGKKK
jgi:hypothetical protein